MAEMKDPGGLPPKTKKGIKHIIAVGSGKGGVGKSTLSALLAVALAKEGLKVGILDADVTGPSIPKLLGVREKPFVTDKGVIPPKSSWLGIKVMSVNLVLDDPSKPVVWRGPLIGKAIMQFWEDINWEDTEYLVVDLPPGTADAVLTVMQLIDLDGVVMVSTPQGLSSLIVEKMMHMAKMLEVPLIGIVENMGYAVCPHCGERWDLYGPSHIGQLKERWEVPILAGLPVDREISILSDSGRLEHYTDDAVLKKLADGVLSALNKTVA